MCLTAKLLMHLICSETDPVLSCGKAGMYAVGLRIPSHSTAYTLQNAACCPTVSLLLDRGISPGATSRRKALLVIIYLVSFGIIHNALDHFTKLYVETKMLPKPWAGRKTFPVGMSQMGCRSSLVWHLVVQRNWQS